MTTTESIDGCRLCLDPFADSFTTIDSSGLREKINKVFSFAIKTMAGTSTSVCQHCAFTITDFYQYSEGVRQNQEKLPNMPTKLGVPLDCELLCEEVKVEPHSDAEVEEFMDNERSDCSRDSDSSYEPATKKSKAKGRLRKSYNEDSSAEQDQPQPKKKPTHSKSKTGLDEDDIFLNEYFTMTCELCGATSPTFPLLRDHFRSAHAPEEAYVVCCDKRFYRRYDLLYHIKWHVNPSAFQCELCQRQYKSKDAMIMHQQVKHSGRSVGVKKSETKQPFENQRKARNSMTSEQLTERDEEFANEDEPLCKEDQFLKEHFTMTCELCDATAATFTLLSNHFRMAHVDEKPYVVCCKKRFFRRYDLFNHVKWHSDPNAFQCKLCQKPYKSNDALVLHKQIKHKDEVDEEQETKDNVSVATNDQPKQLEVAKRKGKREQEDEFISKHITLTCDHCYITKPSFCELRTHFRAAHNTNNVYVMCCNEKINKRSLLIDHLKRHNSDYNSETEFCDIQDEPEIDLLIENQTAIDVLMTEKDEGDFATEEISTKTPSEQSEGSIERLTDLESDDELEEDESPIMNEELNLSRNYTSKSILLKVSEVSIEEPADDQLKQCDTEFNESTLPVMKNESTRSQNHTLEVSEGSKEQITDGNSMQCEDGSLENDETPCPEDQFLKEHFTMTCELCGTTVTTFTLLSNHFRASHRYAKPYVMCCKKRFIRRYDLLNHVKWHSDPNAFQCKLCQKSYKSNDALILHRQIKHKDESEKGEAKEGLAMDKEMNVIEKDDQPKQANMAKWEGIREQEDEFISKHMKLECEHCNVIKPTFCKLRTHFREAHGKYTVYVMCCNENFSKRSLLVDHLKGHSSAYHSETEFCDMPDEPEIDLSPADNQPVIEVLAMEEAVEEAQTTIQSDDSSSETLQTEQYEGASSKKKEARAQEDLFLTENYSLKCDICGAAAATFSKLRRHFRAEHSGIITYATCCDKKFTRRCLLLSHIKCHIDPNVFQCELCEKRYTCNDSLIVHRQMKHANKNQQEIKPESTQVETGNTSNKSSRRKGIRNHEDRFISKHIELTCDRCKAVKPTFSELRNHFRSAHATNNAYVVCCNEKIIKRSLLIEHLKGHISTNEWDQASDDSSDDDTEVQLGPVEEQGKEDQIGNFLSKNFCISCDICGAKVSTFKQLREHFYAQHDRQIPYLICCNKKFFKRHLLMNHVRCHVEPNAFQCEYCQKRYLSNDSLILHKQIKHTDEYQQELEESLQPESKGTKKDEYREQEDQFINEIITLTCELCGATASTFEQLCTHFRMVHKKSFAYVICCEKKLFKRGHILSHLKNHPGKNLFQCKRCGSAYTIEEDLLAHTLKCSLPEEVYAHKCNHCAKSFEQRDDLVVHMDEHKIFECSECKRRFVYAVNLNHHMVRMHGSGNDTSFVCEHCGKNFASEITLKRHIESVHSNIDDARVQCRVCDRWLKQSSFKSHMNYVHGARDRTYECSVCLRQYPHLQALRNHKKQTHAVAKHKCRYCDKRFIQKVRWMEHQATHTGEVLFSCEHCGEPYKGKSSMYSHIKKKHPVEWSQRKQQIWQEGF